jgi:hypothetical protein
MGKNSLGSLGRKAEMAALSRGHFDFGFWVLDFGFWVLDLGFLLPSQTSQTSQTSKTDSMLMRLDEP